MSNKPEALRLADELEAMFGATEIDERVTAELRRLYAENERLNNALDELCIDYKATIENLRHRCEVLEKKLRAAQKGERNG